MDSASALPSDIVVVEELSTYFHQDAQFVRAVDGVSFRVPQQGLFGLAGESGSGKTQTALSIAGLVRGGPGVVSGSIWINGQNVLRGLRDYCTVDDQGNALRVRKDVRQWRVQREARMRNVWGQTLSMVFQEPKGSLSPYYTIGDQARETVKVHFGPREAENFVDRTRPLLEDMEFQDPERILASYPHELSGGQSQRAVLALALLPEPDLLIADEPTTLLDALTEQRVLDVFRSAIQKRDLALLLITHDLSVLSQMVDRVAIMRHGNIVEQGPTSTIMRGALEERHPYTRQLRASAKRSGIQSRS